MDARELRVSDSERMAAGELLQKAMAEGFIDLDEFDERTARALSSRNRGQLVDLTADLPPRLRFDAEYDMQAHPAEPSGEPVVLEHSLETVKRGVGWTPPPHMILKAWGGTAVLDLAAARLPERRYRITLDLKGSTARLYLPDGAGVTLAPNLVESSAVKDKRRVFERDPARPELLIDGTAVWTTVKLMGPRRGWWDA